MKSRLKQGLAAVLAAAIIAAAAIVHPLGFAPPMPRQTGQIYLYGEYHMVEAHYEKEFALWSSYYHNNGMRHLFVEYPYAFAEYLNLWMRDEDDFLDRIHLTMPESMDFFRWIKRECPETVFHGTDVGLYEDVSLAYLEYLEASGQTDTERYRITRENMEQGARFLQTPRDNAYRENVMVENFIREMESLNGTDVMGIYGAMHTDIEGMNPYAKSVPCMANQLHEKYGGDLHAQDLVSIAEPLRTETITVGGREYTAQYFGKQYPNWDARYEYMEYWLFDGAFEDFRDNPPVHENRYLSSQNNAIKVEQGQVLVLACIYADGTVEKMYYRAGSLMNGDSPIVERFAVD